MTSGARVEDSVPLQVDRMSCTGHGVCAQILPRNIALDAHGYPILLDDRVDAEEGDTAIRMCPARALYWKGS
ncbi:MAG TPA: ferredoxin [Propionibacteriaceae bacterium]|nr:ferredoxin [Propionibacteriaceae bacterium]